MARTVHTWRAMRHVIVLALLSFGCSAGVQKPALDTAFANDAMRAETFEATLRALDEHPEYVDELFVATLSHPVTLDRFLRATARELERDEFARFTAERLVAEPKGLKRTLVAVLDEASDDPRRFEGRFRGALLKAFGRVGVDKAKGELDAAARALE